MTRVRLPRGGGEVEGRVVEAVLRQLSIMPQPHRPDKYGKQIPPHVSGSAR